MLSLYRAARNRSPSVPCPILPERSSEHRSTVSNGTSRAGVRRFGAEAAVAGGGGPFRTGPQRCTKCPYRPDRAWPLAHYRAMGILLNRLVVTFRGVGRMGSSMLVVLAVSSAPDLRRQLRYLQTENAVLRSQINGQVRVTPAQRSQLVRLRAIIRLAGASRTIIELFGAQACVLASRSGVRYALPDCLYAHCDRSKAAARSYTTQPSRGNRKAMSSGRSFRVR